MNAIHAIVLSASLLAAAGCLGSGAPAGSEPANAPAPAATPDAPRSDAPLEATALAWTDSNWTGYLRAGAAYEAPSHLQETNGPTRSLWSPSFHYSLASAPRDLEVRMDWTATAGQLAFMVIVPGNGTEREQSVMSPTASQGPLCMKLPADHLVAGNYSIMAHSQYAVDARLQFTVARLGGEGQLVDQPHAASAMAFGSAFGDPTALPAAILGGSGGGLTAAPCAHLA
jgi:hypothetical protein